MPRTTREAVPMRMVMPPNCGKPSKGGGGGGTRWATMRTTQQRFGATLVIGSSSKKKGNENLLAIALKRYPPKAHATRGRATKILPRHASTSKTRTPHYMTSVKLHEMPPPPRLRPRSGGAVKGHCRIRQACKMRSPYSCPNLETPCSALSYAPQVLGVTAW